jgi:prepilin-type N-terminal cleavage/methylation domain-containing protein
MKLNKKSKQKAFTLAEVLITIGIIGVVSALTIPTLIKNYQKKVTVEKLKVAYSILSQAVETSKQDNGDLSTWSLQLSSADFANIYILPYLKDWSKIPAYQAYTRGNGGEIPPFNWNTSQLYALSNGMVISLNNDCEQLLQITVDINGKAKPNYMGKDIFIFTISYAKNKLTPYGNHRNGLSRTFLAQTSGHACSKDAKGQYAREYCAGLIMVDGWKISDDYPW